MSSWLCSCGAVNPAGAVACVACAKRSLADSGGLSGGPATAAAGDLVGSIRRQSTDLLASIRGAVAASHADLAAGIVPDVPRAVLPFSTQSARSQQVTAQTFDRVTSRDLDVRVHALSKINYALVHAGMPLIHSVEIKNTSFEPANDLIVRASVAPDYGTPWERTIPRIPALSSHTEQNIFVPLLKSRFQDVFEAEKASLCVDVHVDGSKRYSNTWPIEVLAYNEWFYHPSLAETVACFVQSGAPVEPFVTCTRNRMREQGWPDELCGYQNNSAEDVVRMLRGLYLALQKDLQLSYINPPPSFEKQDGEPTISQKVVFPEQIYAERRGTCLDLALLGAACLERMGLHPVFFLIAGHAFFGVWMEPSMLREPVLRDFSQVAELVRTGRWLALNSTTFAMSDSRPFETCIEEGLHYLSDAASFLCAVDVTTARERGLKPLPPRTAATQ